MDESEFLEVLAEVAGTRRFDAKCERARKMLEDSQTKREKVEMLRNSITQKLELISTEVEEFKEVEGLRLKKNAVKAAISLEEIKGLHKQVDEKNLTKGEKIEALTASKKERSQLTDLRN